MNDVKITVVKQFSPKDVIGKEFIRADGTPIEKCGMKEGLEFTVTESGNMPEGFCHHAWYGLYKNIALLQCGGGFPNWTGEDMIYTACPDGIRPVCFKLERVSKRGD